MPVFTEDLSVDLVKKAMETFSMKMAREMQKSLFGVSAFLKRKLAFGRLKKVPEQITTNQGSI